MLAAPPNDEQLIGLGLLALGLESPCESALSRSPFAKASGDWLSVTLPATLKLHPTEVVFAYVGVCKTKKNAGIARSKQAAEKPFRLSKDVRFEKPMATPNSPQEALTCRCDRRS
jgi:hypothetical protein